MERLMLLMVLLQYISISISPEISKVWDSILLSHQTQARDTTHILQDGFSTEKSCLEASLLVSICIAESKDMYIASLDVQKAFAMVDHSSLLRKMHANGITGQCWLVKLVLMKGMKGRIMWHGQRSDLYEIFQDKKQEGKCSTDEYKGYQLDLLIQIFCSQIGLKIGHIKIPCPTVADMIIAASIVEELQSHLMTCEEYANRERYNIYPEKSVITPFTIASMNQLQFIEESKPWMINKEPVTISPEFTTHLGINSMLQLSIQAPNAIYLLQLDGLSQLGKAYMH